MPDLTTLDLVKSYAGITSSLSDSDIQTLITQTSAIVARMIGHDFDGTPLVEERYNPAGSGRIILRRPTASVEKVQDRDGDVTYQLGSDGRSLWKVGGSGDILRWNAPHLGVLVDSTPESTVPDDVTLAATEAATFAVKQSGLLTGASRFGLSGQANGDTGSAEYFVQQIRTLPYLQTIKAKYQRFY